MALVLDTGVIYAALDTNDLDHQACADLVTATKEQLVVPATVLVEVDYWLRKAGALRVWMDLCQDIYDGAYSIWPIDRDVLLRAAEVQVEYADQPIGLVDASVLAVCEVLGEDKVATLDARHFTVLRASDGRALTLLPELQ